MRTTQVAHERQGHLIGAVEVKPHQAKRIEVGIYEDTMPVPRFHLEYEPDMSDMIGAALQRHDEQGDYKLYYQLENFGDVACVVSVWECRDDMHAVCGG